jgi:hypothetical protein
LRNSSEGLYRVGFWSGLLTVIFSLVYSVAQIGSVLGAFEEPWDLVAMFVPSLFLAFSFVVLMSAVRRYSGNERIIWGDLGVAFAAMYAVLVSLVYFVELVVVIPKVLNDESEAVSLLLFEEGSFMVATDAIGYAFMSISTLFAAFIFSGIREQRWTKRMLLANGAIGPAIALAAISPVFLAIGVFWMVTLPLSAVLLTRLFYKLRKGEPNPPEDPAAG